MEMCDDKRIWINKTIDLLEINIDKINWYGLSKNSNAIHLLEKELKDNSHAANINWYSLSRNKNAITILQKELENNPNSLKIHWFHLSFNPNAIPILEKELKANPYSLKIKWRFLSMNPNASSLLEKELKDNPNSTKIHWSHLSANEGRFELNYELIKERMNIIREDLMKAVYHPTRLEYYLNVFDYDIFDEIYNTDLIGNILLEFEKTNLLTLDSFLSSYTEI